LALAGTNADSGTVPMAFTPDGRIRGTAGLDEGQGSERQ
jgi:hypothetical protein